MGDMADVFNDMKKDKQLRHQQWHVKNVAAIKKSGIPFENKGETLLFREKGKPQVDFYPSTGRWKVIGKGFMNGGAEQFILWYRKQKVSDAGKQGK